MTVLAYLFRRCLWPTAWAVVSASCAWAAVGDGPPQAPPPIVSRIDPLPGGVASGGKVTVTVHYEVAPSLPRVTLHVEMKGSGAVVHAAQTAEVSGRGSKAFAFAAPDAQQVDEIHFAVWYGQDWRLAVIPIVRTQPVSVLTPAEAKRLAAGQAADQAAANAWRRRNAQLLAGEHGSKDVSVNVGILDDDLPALDRKLAAAVTEALRKRGLRVLPLTAAQIVNPGILSAEHFAAVVLGTASVYPSDGGPALERFLGAGGRLVALGTPAFTRAVTRIGGQWMDAEAWSAALAAQKPHRILWDFQQVPPADIRYSSGPGAKADWDVVATPAPIAPGGPRDSGAKRVLHCLVPRFESWNTLAMPAREHPFAPGQTLTCLWARGGAGTTHLSLEWTEKDGSRWIAVIPLTTQWRYYVLAPEAFGYWRDNPSQGRGGRGDRLRPADAVHFTVGLAMTHTPMAPGRREFWVGPIGVARSPFGDSPGPESIRIPPIEALWPSYKFHPVASAKHLRTSDAQRVLGPAELPVPPGLMSVHPRPRGTGYDKHRPWRWIPLLEALDERGEVCGTPACLVLHRTGPYAGAAVASFALPPEALARPEVLDIVARVTACMRDGTFLFEGGAERYAYFTDDRQLVLGARTIHLGRGPQPPCQVSFRVTRDGASRDTPPLDLADGVVRHVLPLDAGARGDAEVTVRLLRDGKVIDELKHPVLFRQPPAKPNYVTVQDGQFRLNGRRWIAHGVNYMPSSGIGTEDGEYFENWLGRRSYDPVVVERDLRRIRAMGMNMVSIFVYHRALADGNLLDILERCRRHGLLVNLSLRPGGPVGGFYWDKMRALIEAYRLAGNDTVFAYDLSWEPMWHGYADRCRWDDEWAKWIETRYGGLSDAEKDWGMPCPRKDGGITGPSDAQLGTEGPHRVMACAYRRFLDDLLDRKWTLARDLVRSIDPHHFVAFRMTCAGDPTFTAAQPAYDFRGLARSVAIMEPEGYGRIGDWGRVRLGRFTVDYARCMAPGRPVLWAELGCQSWDRQKMQPNADQENWVGRFYRDFYRMALESDCDGTVCWWYPGGFRVGEDSDFGIIDPDGTWRPNSRAIADWAPKMIAQRPGRKVDTWIDVDPDATARGVVGIYQQAKDRYWRLVESGKTPGLRQVGWDLDSRSVPPLAVGNVPLHPGHNPPKYLHAQFDRVEYKTPDGDWKALADGDAIAAAKGAEVILRAVVGNLGPAKWLAAAGPGQVRLTCGEHSTPIAQDVSYAQTVTVEGLRLPAPSRPTELTVQMRATGSPGIPFGQKVRIRLVSK